MIYMKNIGRLKYILIIQIIYITFLIIKCFGTCKEFTFDKYNLNKSYEGDLVYFDDDSVGMETQSKSEEVEILNGFLDLGSGAYSVKITYESVRDYGNPSIDSDAGWVMFNTDNSSLRVPEVILLHDEGDEIQSTIWLRPGWRGTNRVRISVWYCGSGKLAVKSIHIEEKREYRIIICIAIILLFAVCDFLYLLIYKKSNVQERVKFIILGILGITVFSSLTYFADFLYVGHDLNFHLSRIISLADGIREFQIPHRMQFKMLNGYGYATPLYYGELFLLLPSVLYIFYVPIQTCYQIYVIFINFITCIISYWCFSRMSKDWRKGLLGSAIYTLSAYRITCILVRAAVGEFTALTFFPLLVYGFYNIYSKEETEKIYFKDYLSVILSATGIINSHILSCEMIVIYLAFFVVINYQKTFRRNVFGALFKCSIFTFCLNLWFIVPFLQSMRMEVKVADRDSINMIESNNVYLAQLFGIFHTADGGNVRWGTQNEMPLAIGFPILLGIVLFLGVCIKKESWGLSNHKKFKVSYTCFILGTTALCFTSNLCKWDNLKSYSWRIAKFAGMVQFSWRYLGIATVCLITMTIFVLQIMEENSSDLCKRAMLFILGSIIITEGHFVMEYVNVKNEVRLYSESSIGTMQILEKEYLLKDTDLEKYKSRTITIEDGTAVTDFYYDRNGKYYLTCVNENNYPVYIDVPVQAYDNYHAYSSNGKELDVTVGENNRIRIHIPEKLDDVICIKYQIPVLWRICEAISFITGCIMLILFKKKEQKLSDMMFVKYKTERGKE